MAKKKMAEEKKPAEPAAQTDAGTWLSLAEASEADRARHRDGVLVSLADRGADPRFATVGLLKLRLVSHGGDGMKRIVAEARKAAVRRHNQDLPAGQRIWRWEDLTPAGHREWEGEVAVASLRGGEGLELHGDFEMPAEELLDTELVQAKFRALLGESPNWLVSGLYLAGSKILSDPRQISDRLILETRKKGSACGLGQALASLVGDAKASLENLGGLSSIVAALTNAAIVSPSTTRPSPAAKTSKRSRSTG